MTKQGLGVLKANGFRPAGPWVVDVGRWSEVTYLFRFDSLAERERLIAKFSETAEARAFDARVGEFVEEITTRLLIPTPFSLKPPAREAAPKTGDDGRLASSRADRAGGSCGGLRRPLSVRQLRLGRAGGRDSAHRPAAWNTRARVSGSGRRDDGQARADAGADQHPGRGYHDHSILDRKRGHPRFDLARARTRGCSRPGVAVVLESARARRPHADRRLGGLCRIPAARPDCGPGRRGRLDCGPRGAFRRSAGRAWPACRAGRQRHGAMGRDPAPAGGTGAGAGCPRVWLLGRPRTAHPPAPILDRASPAGRLPHLPGSAP